MEANIKVDLSTPQARKFVEFASMLPFTVVEDTVWQQALAEGAMTVEEFIEKGRRMSREQFEKTKRA